MSKAHKGQSGYFPRNLSDATPILADHTSSREISPRESLDVGGVHPPSAGRASSVYSALPSHPTHGAENSNSQGGGLTFLPFDVIDPDYGAPRQRQESAPTSRNPFSYLARRFGSHGDATPRRRGREQFRGFRTISDGLMPSGSNFPYQTQNLPEGDEPLRRFSTTAIAAPEPLEPITTSRTVGYSSASTSGEEIGGYDRDFARHRKRRSRQSIHPLRYQPSPSLHPYEMAVENVGLLHDPLFGLPTIDTNPEATARMLDIEPIGMDGLRRRNHDTAASAESESGREDQGHRRREAYPSADASPPLHGEGPESARRPIGGLPDRRRRIPRYHHHPLPRAINPLPHIVRNSEAAQMKCWWKRELFLLMEDPSSGAWAFVINVCICLLIVACAVIAVVETIPSLLVSNSNLWFNLESVFVGIFTLEFATRLVAHTDNRRQFLRFAFSFLTVVDLAAILPYYIELGVVNDRAYEFRFTIVRIFRLFRIFSVFKYSSLLQLSVEVMLIAMRRSIDALLALLLFVVLTIVIISTIMYFIERGTYDPEKGYFVDRTGEQSSFDSIPASMWFVMVALTTTGFGDSTPKTVWGKLMTFPLVMIGVLLIALPSIIVGREFTVVWQAMKLRRRKEFQVAQQMQREAKRRDRPRGGDLPRQKGRRDGDPNARFLSSSDQEGKKPGRFGYKIDSGEPGSSNTLPLEPQRTLTTAPDAAIINIPPSDEDARAQDTSGTVVPLAANDTLVGSRNRINTQRTNSSKEGDEISPLSSPDGNTHKGRYSRNPFQMPSRHMKTVHSDLSLTRTSTADLRKYSPDRAFMALAMGLGRPNLGKKKRGSVHHHHHHRTHTKGRNRSQYNEPGQPPSRVLTGGLRDKLGPRSHPHHHKPSETNDEDEVLSDDIESLNLGSDIDSDITTDMSGSEISIDSDLDNGIDAKTKETLEKLPATIDEMKQMFQSMQETQQLLQQSLLTMNQRISKLESPTKASSGSDSLALGNAHKNGGPSGTTSPPKVSSLADKGSSGKKPVSVASALGSTSGGPSSGATAISFQFRPEIHRRSSSFISSPLQAQSVLPRPGGTSTDNKGERLAEDSDPLARPPPPPLHRDATFPGKLGGTKGDASSFTSHRKLGDGDNLRITTSVSARSSPRLGPASASVFKESSGSPARGFPPASRLANTSFRKPLLNLPEIPPYRPKSPNSASTSAMPKSDKNASSVSPTQPNIEKRKDKQPSTSPPSSPEHATVE
ncbi:hypothetical protein IWQ62_003152 [Dispira parvispora]|uniref:Ion transport domain-containing protein n=1 Tax=Dispira parvispora TaxID=1520584 RepID=A0A9W8ANH0_9FUNG|nr:hypothetical protein IWQ62_003152 [Dispira parvispora]